MANLESKESRENLDRRVTLEPLDPKDPLVLLDLQWVSLDMFFFSENQINSFLPFGNLLIEGRTVFNFCWVVLAVQKE